MIIIFIIIIIIIVHITNANAPVMPVRISISYYIISIIINRHQYKNELCFLRVYTIYILS